MTVLFSVEPSHSPSGTLIPSVVIPSATTQQRPFSSIPSSISAARRTSASGRDISARRCSPVRPTNSRLTADFDRRALGVDDVLADRLARAREPARRDAGEHLLEHDPGQRVAIGEVRVRRQRHLVLAVGGPHPRALHTDTPAAERDLAGLVAVAHRGPVGVALALRADDLVDLALHHLGQHAQPDADAQRQQPILRRVDELAERLLHARRQRQLLRGDLRPALRSSWRSLRLGGLVRTRHAPNGSRTRRGTATYEVLRATGVRPDGWRSMSRTS